jgi:hypothetical protein
MPGKYHELRFLLVVHDNGDSHDLFRAREVCGAECYAKAANELLREASESAEPR